MQMTPWSTATMELIMLYKEVLASYNDSFF